MKHVTIVLFITFISFNINAQVFFTPSSGAYINSNYEFKDLTNTYYSSFIGGKFSAELTRFIEPYIFTRLNISSQMDNMSGIGIDFKANSRYIRSGFSTRIEYTTFGKSLDGYGGIFLEFGQRTGESATCRISLGYNTSYFLEKVVGEFIISWPFPIR